jgi:uncharacterized protein (DUF1501 family)
VKTSNTTSPRRNFLKRLAVGSAVGAAPTLAALSSVAEAAAPGNNQTTEVAADYKAIVCVYLYGGQDHGNVLVPYQDNATSGTTEYNRYATSRRPVGAPQTESGNDLAFRRTTLGANGEARVITSTDTAGMPAGFTTNVYGRRFALNPSYNEIAFLYKQANSKLAMIANVGPMIAPLNRDAWYRIQTGFGDSPLLPANLYSHDDQQKAWMSGQANVLNPEEGAGGRIASALVSLNGAARVPIAVSVSGINTFMLTNDALAQPYQVGAGYVGRVDVSGGTPSVATCNTEGGYISNNPTKNYCLAGGPIAVRNGYSWQTTLQNTMLARFSPAAASANIYARQWIETMDLSVRTEAAISDALIKNPLNEDTVKSFSEYRPSSNPTAAAINVVDTPDDGYNELAAQLRITAALIRASAGLGASSGSPVKRQIFFVGIGGFDTHGSEFWSELPLQNKKIDRAIDAFWQAMSKIKVQGSATGTGQDQVTLFTMSDFGRTLDSNGVGSDHGWGGHHIVLGGAVKGGKIYGANHNVTAADIPDDAELPSQKSRYMSVDATAGAVPRSGVPPLWYEQNEGNTGPGGKAAGLNHSLDRGELLVTMASDAYMATIARWFGVTTAQLPGIFPTLNTAHPGFTGLAGGVGFMNI